MKRLLVTFFFTALLVFVGWLTWTITSHAAGRAMTFDCTPAVDAVTGAQIQIGTGTPFDVPLVSTCGSGADKVTCTDPASKTICWPDTSWPTGAFTAKAYVRNARDTSGASNPLAVPGVPTSPGSLRSIMQ